MICMPADELPVDVLTELGRVTWAAIKLEDYAEGICSDINPADPRTDTRQLSRKIRDAKKALAAWLDTELRAEATAWLERARLAMERRNAALHATPMVWIKRGQRDQMLLGEMPHKGRPYTERPLTVESLAELRLVLEGAAAGWRELTLAVSAAMTGRAVDTAEG
jgi:hypothetical protein